MDIQSVIDVIRSAAQADDTVLMEGAHGIGKSEIVKQFANEDDYHMETLFLSHQDVGDLVGIPHITEKDGTKLTVWSVPIWLQRMHQAAWPDEFVFNDLTFSDEKFKKFVLSRIAENSYNV